MPSSDLTLDAGALIAIERRDDHTFALLDRVIRRGGRLDVVPEVLTQVWRGGSRQAQLAKFLTLTAVRFPAYDEHTARVVGELCGRTGHHDVVDVHVVVHARRHGHAVVTSDPDDLRRVDPNLAIIEI
jgi:predicted nucleic acid-binding protein